MMNDDKIIKALEYCLEQGITSDCERCKVKIGCRDTLLKDALDLINRQKTEINILIRKKETLKDEISELRAEVERYEKTVGKLAVNEDGTVVGLTIDGEVEYIPRDLAETFRNLAVRYVCEQFTKKFKQYIKDIGLTWGQKWDINCALKRVFYELTERKEDEGK